MNQTRRENLVTLAGLAFSGLEPVSRTQRNKVRDLYQLVMDYKVERKGASTAGMTLDHYRLGAVRNYKDVFELRVGVQETRNSWINYVDQTFLSPTFDGIVDYAELWIRPSRQQIQVFNLEKPYRYTGRFLQAVDDIYKIMKHHPDRIRPVNHLL